MVTQPVPASASLRVQSQRGTAYAVPTSSPSPGQFSGCATVAQVAQVALKLKVVATRLLASFHAVLAAKAPGLAQGARECQGGIGGGIGGIGGTGGALIMR